MHIFRGNRRSTATIKPRLAAIVKANPWLCGKLVKGKHGLLEVHFAQNPSDEDISSLLNPSMRGKSGKIVVDSCSYYSVCENVGGTSAEVLKGSSCIGKDERLFLVPSLRMPNGQTIPLRWCSVGAT